MNILGLIKDILIILACTGAVLALVRAAVYILYEFNGSEDGEEK